MNARQIIRLTQGLGFALALLIGGLRCSVNPATGRQQLAFFGEAEEIKMGREADEEIVAGLGLYPDQGLQAYVREVGLRLAAASERPGLPWSFQVVDDPVVNAFALPGGYIYVTRGILGHLSSEAELAAVLGHEIGHVTARHAVNRLSKQTLGLLGVGVVAILTPDLENLHDAALAGLGLLFLKYSRDDERQADDLGLRYAVATGFNPAAMPEVFAVLARVGEQKKGSQLPNWLSTHPDPGARQERVGKEIAGMGRDFSSATVNRDPYLERLSGLAFGPNPRAGYFEQEQFFHPDLAFRCDFPPGWTTSNDKSAVTAVSPEDDALVRIGLSAESTLEQAAEKFLAEEAVKGGTPVRSQVNGLPALWVSFTATSDSMNLSGQMLFIAHAEKVFQILGVARSDRWRSRSPAVEGAMKSFARLTDAKALAVQPPRLALVRLDRSMKLEEFARRYPSTGDLPTLALINHLEGPSSQIPAGTLVKRVVPG